MDRIEEIKEGYAVRIAHTKNFFTIETNDYKFLISEITRLTQDLTAYKEIEDSLQKEIKRLDEENAGLKKRPAFAEGFTKGREAVLRRNPSGCCCLFNEEEEIVSVCAAHKEREERLMVDYRCLKEELYECKHQRDELREYKEEIEAQFRKIMDEKCPKDEVHCTCVPFLRIEVAKLRERLKGIDEVYKNYTDPLLIEPNYYRRGQDSWNAIKQARRGNEIP